MKRKMNRGIMTAITGIVIAQGLKVLTYYRKNKEWDLSQVISTGGMPSSHSAGVSALAAYVASNKGTRHTETALAVVLSVIVMHDAQGIRRHTGEIARLVNDLEDSIAEISGDLPSFDFVEREEELKELLGHEPMEVVGGAVLGALLGFTYAKIENRT